CLVVRDEKADSNPSATLEVTGVDAATAYVVRGWLRAPQALAAAPLVRVAAMGADGRVLRWLDLPPVAAGVEWTPFALDLAGLPAGCTRLSLAIQPCGGQPATATGEVRVDDLEFHPAGGSAPAPRPPSDDDPLPTPAAATAAATAPPSPLTAGAPWRPGLALPAGFAALDLAAVANRGFADDTADDGTGGWTDQGDNDLRGMPSGLVEVGGVPFAVVNPAANQGRSALILRPGAAPAFAAQASLAAGRRADWISLLHASAWTGRDAVVGRIELRYADGGHASLPVVVGEQVADWWGGESRRSHARPLSGVNPRRDPVYLHAASFANPRPGVALEAVELHAAGTGKATWMVLAATLANGADPVVPTLWADGKLMDPAEVARLGLVQPEALEAPAVPLRLTPGPALALTVDVGTTLRATPRAVAGIAFHRVVGYGLGAFPAPYSTAFPFPLTVTPEQQRRIRALRVPMTRFYGVGDEPFPVEEAIDRIAALLDRVGIPQQGCVLELEEQGANEALRPAAWARAVRHVQGRGYGFHRWEIGNEVYTGGLWKVGGRAFPTPEHYIAHAKAVAAAVRAEQPQALIGVSFFDASTRWGNQVLKGLAGHYDFAVAHWYQFPCHERDFEATVIDENHWTLDRMQVVNALLERYNPGRAVRQYDTEWGLHARGGKDYRGGGIPPGAEVGAYRPNANVIGVVQRAVRLIYLLREGMLDGAGLWCMFGRTEQPALTVLPQGADAGGRTTMVYCLYRQLAEAMEDRVVAIGGEAPFRSMGKALRGRTGVQVPLTPAVAMADAAGTRVSLMIANGSWTASYPARVALRGFAPATAEAVVLSHGDPDADPIIAGPGEVVAPLPVAVEGGELRFTLPPHAVAFIRLR
ncbi:MAG: hypothetical protein L6R48_18640, partial [Planctomycetes bacterium]|nr:hypothetical protein [Planctomycetota bacterium]